MGQAYQLEESSDRYLLEDGSGVYLHEVQDVTLALTGLQSAVQAGTVRADWHLVSAGGLVGATLAVPLAGLESTAAGGTVTAEGESSPDRDAALSGLDTTAESGLLGVGLDLSPSGLASASDLGTVQPDTRVAGLGLESVSALGTVTVLGDVTEALSGQELVVSAGTLTPTGGDVADDLVALQRRRRFGKSSMPLVRQPYPRKVR